MSIGQAIDEIAKRWKSITGLLTVIIGLTVFMVTFMGRVDAGEKKAVKHDTQIQLLTELVQDMKVQVGRIDANLALILQMYGYDSSQVRKWEALPTAPVIDTATGKPVLGTEWIEIYPKWGYYAIASMDSVVGFHISRSIAWDLRK